MFLLHIIQIPNSKKGPKLKTEKNCETLVLRIKMISSPLLLQRIQQPSPKLQINIFTHCFEQSLQVSFSFYTVFFVKNNPNEYKIIMQFLNWLLDPARNKIHNFFISFEVWMNGLILWLRINTGLSSLGVPGVPWHTQILS